MFWGIAISIIIFSGALVFMYRSASKLKVSKTYINRILTKIMPGKSFRNEDIELKKIAITELAGENQVEDRFYYHVKAIDSESVCHEFEARVFDPSAEYDEALYREQQKNARPQEESMNATGAGMSSTVHAAGIESAQSMLRDQAKLEKEDRLIQKNIKKLQIDIEVVKKLNQVSEILPKIHFYDNRKQFVLSEFTGSVSLKSTLENISKAEKNELISKIVIELAHIHNAFDKVAVLLPSRRPMDAENFRSMLKQGLKQLIKAKFLSEHQANELLNEYYPVASWLGDNFSSNIRFRGVTPYDIYVVNNKPYIRNWNSIDTSSVMTNMLELLKDPVTDINYEQEADLIKKYNNARFGSPSLEQTSKLYHLTSCHLLTIQLCYMIIYIKQKTEKNIAENVLINWDQEHFDLLFRNATENWSKFEESRDFANQIREIFQRI